MRLISYDDPGGVIRLGVESAGRAIAADQLLPGGPATMAALLAGGDASLDALRSAADPARIERDGRAVGELRLRAPVPRPGKVVAIGRNYPDHVAENAGAPVPQSPLIFAKWPSCVIGHGDEIRWDPALTSQVDYEAELAVVIGRTARRVAEADALSYVLGYTCLDDISARDLQFGDGQWVRGKSLDTFCPIGPAIVTADEIADPDDLGIFCTVNGTVVQNARTSEMYFSVARIISHCSEAFTLEPGDVIATGTPAGVGAFQKPPRFLADGDQVTISIEGIGDLVNVCRFDGWAARG
jgi:2-keto-4-pentenoate hydratase/2-oxohepta-3-ene-1,7-dioic acid hydratase in catechol pathway